MSAASMPPPASPAGEVRTSPVPGRVEVITDEPLQLPALQPVSLRDRLSELLNRRPWLAPALLLGLGAAVLLRRRR